MRHPRLLVRLGLAAALLGSAATAQAASLLFTGSQSNVNLPASASGRCAPAALTVSIGPGILSSSGASNFGSFEATQSHCIKPPLPAPYTDGLFDYAFAAGDHLFGTYSGVLSPSGSPGLFNNLQNFLVSGGTGRFSGASGEFTGVGTVQFSPTQAASNIDFSGRLNLAPVPEPHTWLMMILGLGMAGLLLRVRRAPKGRTASRGTSLAAMCVAAAMATGLGATAAQAEVLFDYVGPSTPIPTDIYAPVATFTGRAGAAEASFSLFGYDSLDGQGFFEDDFTLSINDNPILKGTYDLGGGGADVTFFKPLGATVTNFTVGSRNGGEVRITTPLTLVDGLNRLEFFYYALPAPGHAGFQSMFDERWSVGNLLITQVGVPETSTWSLFILGFAAIGSFLRRRPAAVA